jgi:ribosomal protein L11 methylase PrmA
MEVLADSALSDSGSLNYDLILANFFADQIDNLPSRINKESVKSNRRIMVRLIKESNSVKERLSANKEVHIAIEGLYDN